MTPLSKLLKQDRPFEVSSIPEEPVEVHRAVANIRRQWGDADAMGSETNPEALAFRMERRRRNDDWLEFSWSDASRTAVAVLDSDLWKDARFKGLFRFMLDQIGRGANGPYVRTMFDMYLQTFDPESNATRSLAVVLKRHWDDMTSNRARAIVTALPIGSLADDFHIFDLDKDPPRTIAEYMDSQHDPFRALCAVGMKAPHGKGLMQRAHSLFVEKVTLRIQDGDPDAVKRLLNWISPPTQRNPLLGNRAGEALDALLLPWSRDDPMPAIKTLLETRLVHAYGDPRGRSSGAWSTCNNASRDVMLKWLAGATIRAFFDIVTQADGTHMWSDRKRLWDDLHREGRITQACCALSRKGMDIARRLDDKREDIALAENRSSTAQDRRKCLLMMSIDGRWVVEGSHVFPTWVFPRGELATFRPFESSYTCEQFRCARGPERPERIVHSRTWKNTVLAALQR